MTAITLHQGDNRVNLRRLIDQGVQVHSVVTDPPYGLTSVTRRFGKEGAAPAGFGSDGAFQRASAGFMGSKWDGTGIERDPEFWALVLEILLPGGYCLAFSSPRTGHWQACAMELAGFVMHPFKGWVYGQGLPKDSDAQRAIDCHLCTLPGRHYETTLPRERWPGDHICPATPEGAAWEGWGYGTQADKPALEPIYVGQKPFSEKNGALNLLRHGAGAINIDACRVPLDGLADASQLRTMQRGERSISDGWGMGATPDATVVRPQGRHPANLLHDGSAEVVALFPQSKGQQGDVKGTEPSNPTDEIYGQFAGRVPAAARGDTGSAARFFNAFPPSEEDYRRIAELAIIEDLDADPIRYQGKATKADRAGSRHPTVKPIALMRWLCRLVTPPGGTVLDPFAGTGTTGQAARDEGFDCILIEGDPRYAADIRRRFPELPPPALPPAIADLLGEARAQIDALVG